MSKSQAKVKVIFLRDEGLSVRLSVTRMHGSAIRCVRSHDQSIWKNGKFDPP